MAVDPVVLLNAELLQAQCQQALNDATATVTKLKNQQMQDDINAKINVITNPAPIVTS